MTADPCLAATEWFQQLRDALAELPPEDEFTFLAHHMALAYIHPFQALQARLAFIDAFEATAQHLFHDEQIGDKGVSHEQQ